MGLEKLAKWLALDNIRRRNLSTSAWLRNPVMSRASGPRVFKDKARVFKDKTADWICWRAVSVNFFPSWFRLTYLIPKQSWRWHFFRFFVCKRHCDDCNSFGWMGRSKDVMQRYLSVKVLINIQGMTPYRFHKECLKCLLPSRMKPNNKWL